MQTDAKQTEPSKKFYYKAKFGSKNFTFDNLSEIDEIKKENPDLPLIELKRIDYKEYVFSDTEGFFYDMETRIKNTQYSLFGRESASIDDKFLSLITQVDDMIKYLQECKNDLQNQHHFFS